MTEHRRGWRPVVDTPGDAWDLETDVVVVGSGGSGLVAALMALVAGAEVTVLEKGDTLGGTTAKSGFGTWVPNNHHMQALKIVDEREAALRYMARTARPVSYRPNDPTLGLPEWEYELLAAFYDHGAAAFASLEELGVLSTRRVADFPDDHADLAENEVSYGRYSVAWTAAGTPSDGRQVVDSLAQEIDRRGGRLLTSHTVVSAVAADDGGLRGVLVDAPGRSLAVRARRAVVFACGGFGHNGDMRLSYLKGPVRAGCGAVTNEGDFVPIAQGLGAALSNMAESWTAPVVLERSLAGDPAFRSTFGIVGDSMLCVNRYGVRAMNEKANYFDIVAPMLLWDGSRCEYPNAPMFVVWDERNAALFGGTQIDAGLMPAVDVEEPHVLRGETLDDLAAALEQRLELLADAIGAVSLAADFGAVLTATMQRFNEFARVGYDGDFRRGETTSERHKHSLARIQALTGSGFGQAAAADEGGAGSPEAENQPDFANAAVDGNPFPNSTMFPLSDEGPYFATILAPGVIDTKGGPRTNANGQVLDYSSEPIPRLYAVGNCAASPTAQGSWAAGGTLGPMVTFAWLAGQHAASGAHAAGGDRVFV